MSTSGLAVKSLGRSRVRLGSAFRLVAPWLGWALAAYFVGTTIKGALANYSPVPFWDMWPGYLTFNNQILDGVYSAWFAQHTEHRLLVGNVFFWLDFNAFGGRATFLHVMNVVLIGTLAALALWAVRNQRTHGSDRRLAVALGGITTALCFSWLQHENINWGFQTSFFVSLVFPLAAFAALQTALRKSAPAWMAMALLLGILSAGTMANGLAVLPMMILALLIARRPRWAGLLALFSALGVILYFTGYRTPALNASVTESLGTRPWQVIRYAFTFMGGIFGHSANGPTRQTAAEIAGAAGLLALATLFVLSWRRDGARSWVNCVTLFLGFLVLSGVATAAGRVNFGLEQALSSRYLTYSLLFWAFLLIWAFREAEWIGRGSAATVVAGLVIVVVILPVQRTALHPADDRNLNRLVAAMAFELGVHDKKQIEWIFPWIDVGFILSQLPRERNQSVFGDDRFRDRREQLRSPSNVASAVCVAELSSRESIPGDSSFDRVEGWIARQSAGAETPSAVGFVNATGSYVGFAVVGTGSFLAEGSGSRARPFKGYLLADSDRDALSIVGLEPACSAIRSETQPR